MAGEPCEMTNPALGRRMSVNGEKLLKRDKPRELIFPSNYDLLRHLQYATHFPIPLVSHIPLLSALSGLARLLVVEGPALAPIAKFLFSYYFECHLG